MASSSSRVRMKKNSSQDSTIQGKFIHPVYRPLPSSSVTSLASAHLFSCTMLSNFHFVSLVISAYTWKKGKHWLLLDTFGCRQMPTTRFLRWRSLYSGNVITSPPKGKLFFERNQKYEMKWNIVIISVLSSVISIACRWQVASNLRHRNGGNMWTSVLWRRCVHWTTPDDAGQNPGCRFR